jgi:uncharacterized protein YndB with AHSA1/START domain
MMKLLKFAFGLVAVLALVLVVGGTFLSPTFTVERRITIQAPAERVFALVADPREWKRWGVWSQRDPAMAIEYSGPASGTDAVWAWKSQSQGDGRMRFTAAEPSRRLAYELYFPDFGTTSTGELRLQAQGAGTEVVWVMNGDMGRNPLFRWIALNADAMVGKDFEAGLQNLKQLAETN